MILSTALLFRRVGWESEALGVEAAARSVLLKDMATQDLGGTMTCRQMGRAILDHLPH